MIDYYYVESQPSVGLLNSSSEFFLFSYSPLLNKLKLLKQCTLKGANGVDLNDWGNCVALSLSSPFFIVAMEKKKLFFYDWNAKCIHTQEGSNPASEKTREHNNKNVKVRVNFLYCSEDRLYFTKTRPLYGQNK